jgi:hypothetical protein
VGQHKDAIGKITLFFADPELCLYKGDIALAYEIAPMYRESLRIYPVDFQFPVEGFVANL